MVSRLRAAVGARASSDAALGARLLTAGVLAAVVAVPFLLLFVLVEDRWDPLRRLDQGVAQSLNDVAVRDPLLVSALRLVSDVFSPTAFRLVALVLVVVLWRRGLTRLAVWVLVTVGGSGLVDEVAKLVAGRQRPVLDHPVATARGLSYPSGHALGSLVGVCVLLLVLLPVVPPRWRRAARAAGVLVVLAVGAARVGLGVHYVSDVVGGWLLGAAWLVATTTAFSAWRQEQGRPAVDASDGLEPESADRLDGSSAPSPGSADTTV